MQARPARAVLAALGPSRCVQEFGLPLVKCILYDDRRTESSRHCSVSSLIIQFERILSTQGMFDILKQRCTLNLIQPFNRLNQNLRLSGFGNVNVALAWRNQNWNIPPDTCPSRSCRDLNHGQPSAGRNELNLHFFVVGNFQLHIQVT